MGPVEGRGVRGGVGCGEAVLDVLERHGHVLDRAGKMLIYWYVNPPVLERIYRDVHSRLMAKACGVSDAAWGFPGVPV